MGELGEDDLRITLSSQSTRFEQRSTVPDATAINEKSSLDVIDGIDDEVEALPEFVVEDSFIFGVNSFLTSIEVDLGIHDLTSFAGTFGLGEADVFLTEEELSVEVGHFDLIVISDNGTTVLFATETHQSEHLDVFATESTSTDQESALFL